MKAIQCISLLYQLTTFFAYERWVSLIILFCHTIIKMNNSGNSIALPGNPFSNRALQLLGKNNIVRTGERTGPMDSYTNHPWVKKVLLSNLLRSEGETK